MDSRHSPLDSRIVNVAGNAARIEVEREHPPRGRARVIDRLVCAIPGTVLRLRAKRVLSDAIIATTRRMPSCNGSAFSVSIPSGLSLGGRNTARRNHMDRSHTLH